MHLWVFRQFAFSSFFRKRINHLVVHHHRRLRAPCFQLARALHASSHKCDGAAPRPTSQWQEAPRHSFRLVSAPHSRLPCCSAATHPTPLHGAPTHQVYYASRSTTRQSIHGARTVACSVSKLQLEATCSSGTAVRCQRSSAPFAISSSPTNKKHR